MRSRIDVDWNESTGPVHGRAPGRQSAMASDLLGSPNNDGCPQFYALTIRELA